MSAWRRIGIFENLHAKPKLLFILLAMIHAAPRAQGGYLKTDGIYIRNNAGQGDTVWLYGVNFGGIIHETWMSPLDGAGNDWDAMNTLTQRFGAASMWKLYNIYMDSWTTDQDFKNIAQEGMNCIRYPFFFYDYMDDQGNWRLDADGNIDFSRLDKFVAGARAQGIYTVLDMHGAPGSQNGADHSGRQNGALLYSTQRYQSMLVKFWNGIADHFKDNEAVAGYDVLNEPSENYPSNMGSQVVALYDSSYHAIRRADTNHIVFLEAIWSWNTLPDPKTKNWSNVVYELHNYQWNNNGDFNVMKSSVDGWINDAHTWQAKYHVPLFTGEFTLFDNPQSWTYGLSAMVKNDWNWAFWTYKVFSPGSNWGLYDAKNGNANVPNVQSDSYDQIAQKWGSWDTPTYFTRNSAVGDAVKAATALRKVVRPTTTSVSSPEAHPTFAIALSGSTLRISFPPGDATKSSGWELKLISLQGRIVADVHAIGPAVVMNAPMQSGMYVISIRDAWGHVYRSRISLCRH